MVKKVEKIEKKENFWRDLFKLLSQSKRDFKIIFVLIILVELVALISPYLLKLIIDKITNFKPEYVKELLILVAFTFLVENINSIISYFKSKIIIKSLVDISYYLPVKAQEKLVELPLSYHESENTGNKIVKIESGSSKLVDFVYGLVWEVLPVFIQLFLTFSILFFTDWKFGLIIVFFSVIFIWMTSSSNKKVASLRKKRHKNAEISSGKMAQSIININTVKSFVQEEKEILAFSKIKKEVRNFFLKEWDVVLGVSLIKNIILVIGRISILFVGIFLISKNKISVGSLVFIFTLSEKSFLSLFRLTRFYDKMEEGKEAVRRFIDLLNTENTIKNPENGFAPEKIEGKIEFQNVDFLYSEAKSKALNQLNLTIEAGKVTALVGSSGSGKTTLARMIYRHYDPNSGKILLDGKDLREYDISAFRKFLAIVPQEVEIFDLSVRDNIAYAKPEASFEEIKRVAKMANVDEFIEKLSDGYDTKVGERGVKLSGGQRQRLGIARALLINPRVLIFDEATSNLDSLSEKLIQDAMDKIKEGRTMIVIAHRLSTIKKADKIVVLENGKIIEEGNHQELLENKNGIYTRLLDLQKVGEIED